MQKLITIYLDNTAYPTKFGKAYGDKHGFIEEHIKDYLLNGWNVKSITAFGGNNDSWNVRGWLIVLLEKENNEDTIKN